MANAAASYDTSSRRDGRTGAGHMRRKRRLLVHVTIDMHTKPTHRVHVVPMADSPIAVAGGRSD